MNHYLAGFLGILTAYITGSLPFGKWLAAARGVNILQEGSGNIGATNVWRTLGPKFGLLVLLLDTLKGFLPSFFLPALAGAPLGDPQWGILFGACAVIGHSISPFLGFKGGKSVATALGVMIAVTPSVAALAFGSFLVTLAVSRYVSLGSIVGSIAAPFMAAGFGFPPVVIVVYSVLAALIVYRHVPNIKRLTKGEETKFAIKRERSDT